MTHSEYINFVDNFLNDMRDITLAKNKDYSPDEGDALSQFKEMGEALGVSPQVYLITHASKHWLSILRHAKTGHLESEGLAGRCLDLANYCMLYLALCEDLEDRRTGDLLGGPG